jgi:NAD(P)-dependent dehydrogenase (short-subunit alcohol dehydrogenase family)
VRLCRLFWPALKERRGTVVNIVGGFARAPAADFLVGGAVNAALANFSKGLAAVGLRDDVNVNWIHPGLTVTERLEEIFARRAEQQGKSRDEIERESVAAEGLRRLGQPEDVAALVAFLCSPAARHIHGAGIPIDGGGAKGYY